jgi:hypothetical protein
MLIELNNQFDFQLNCSGCATELYMQQLNQEYSEHEFRLLRVFNDQFIYVTIRKLPMSVSRTLQESFLDQTDAKQ